MPRKNISESEYAKIVNAVRGNVLSACINLEIMMDLYISEKFADSNDKINELASLIITPRVSWREKLEVFKFLVTKYNPEFKKGKTEVL